VFAVFIALSLSVVYWDVERGSQGVGFGGLGVYILLRPPLGLHLNSWSLEAFLPVLPHIGGAIDNDVFDLFFKLLVIEPNLTKVPSCQILMYSSRSR